MATSRTPSHLWIDSRSTTVYSTMQDSDELVAIDIATQTIKWRVKTGPMPADVYGSPDGKHLFVGLTGGDSVEVVAMQGRGVTRLHVTPVLDPNRTEAEEGDVE